MSHLLNGAGLPTDIARHRWLAVALGTGRTLGMPMRLGTPRVRDVVLAAVVAVLGTVSAYFTDFSTTVDRPVDALAFTLATIGGLGLAVRREWPLASLAVTTLATSVFLLLGYPYSFIMLTVAVAVYTVARHLPLARSVPAALAVLPFLLAHALTHPDALPGAAALAPGSAWVAVPFAVGVVVRSQRESAARDRAELVRRHVQDERLRVAQEVHDVVGHGLAAIKMQADVGLHLLARKPEQAEQALTTISQTSADALDELRATLAVVRKAESDEQRSPAASLDRLDALRQRMADAGLDVRLDIAGTRRDLPAAVDFAGYRVVQESLTNALRHGAAKVATVRVEYDTDAVIIEVSNPAPSGTPEGGAAFGLGIPGMRHRVTSLDGEFASGRTPAGVFEVRACLPTGGRA